MEHVFPRGESQRGVQMAPSLHGVARERARDSMCTLNQGWVLRLRLIELSLQRRELRHLVLQLCTSGLQGATRASSLGSLSSTAKFGYMYIPDELLLLHSYEAESFTRVCVAKEQDITSANLTEVLP